MSTENIRSWDKPITQYEAMDLVLDANDLGAAVKTWAMDQGIISIDGLDIPKDAQVTVTLSNGKVRVQYIWQEDDLQSELADALSDMLKAHPPTPSPNDTSREARERWDIKQRAIDVAKETIAKWRAPE